MSLPVGLVVLGTEACQLLSTRRVPFRFAVPATVDVGGRHWCVNGGF